MIPVVFHPDAQAEFADAARYYESRQAGLGERFRSLVQRIESDISENPETGFIHDFDTQVRLVRKFPYGVIFKGYSDHQDVR